MSSIAVRRGLDTSLLMALILSTPLSASWAEGISSDKRTFEALSGQVVLDNDRVSVERYSIPPGQSTGRRNSGSNELLVFIKGGVLRSEATGRAVLWRDGRVVWHDAAEKSSGGSVNAGKTPIEVVVVRLKPHTRSAASVASRPVSYPNVAGEDLLENDYVLVQRFELQPGQWEGPHGHGPNSLWIFIRGGRGAERRKGTPEHREVFRDGEVGWMPAVDPALEHESGNLDSHPSNWLWVTLKE